MIALIAVYPDCISVGDDKNRRLRGSELVKGPALATAADSRPAEAHNRGNMYGCLTVSRPGDQLLAVGPEAASGFVVQGDELFAGGPEAALRGLTLG